MLACEIIIKYEKITSMPNLLCNGSHGIYKNGMKGLAIEEIMGNVCPVFATIGLFSNFDLFVFIFI